MAAPSEAMRFTHVYLENWRNFIRAEADLERRAVIAGPSAAGKTNFLDAFRFLHDLVCGTGFQAAVKRRGGVPRIRCLAARQHSDVVIAIRAANGGPDWEYELRFTQENLKKPVIRCERVTLSGNEILSRPDENDAADPERLTETAIGQHHSNLPFRELAEFFASVRYTNPCPQLVRRPGVLPDVDEDPYGSGLLSRISSAPDHVQHSRLKRILEAVGGAVPRLEALQLWRDTHGAPHLRARYGHWRSQGAWQTEDQFSDGTLRLLAILWEALDGKGPLLIDEPDLSLDPALAGELLSMLGSVLRRTRQTLITTEAKEVAGDSRLDAKEILLLVPEEEETEVRPALNAEDAPALLDGRLRTGPELVPIDENQLFLFEAEPEPAVQLGEG